MIKFISKFPYIIIVKGGYLNITMNNNELSQRQKDLIKFVNDIISVDNTSIKKIRYVFKNPFLYDIDNNKINPKYQILRPINFRKQRPDIEINKPENSIEISIGEFINIDDSDMIRFFINNNKKGVVMFINEKDFHGIVGIVGLNNYLDDNCNNFK